MSIEIEQELYSPYAPIRLRNINWWQFARKVTREGWVTPQGEIERRLPDRITDELVRPHVLNIQDTIKNHPGASTILGKIIVDMQSTRYWVPLIGQYLENGKEIFDLTDSLVESLTYTDVKDASLQGLHLPYEAFYMRFGKQQTMRLPFPGDADDPDPWEYFDGAFVARAKWPELPLGRHRLVFGLTTVRGDGLGRKAPGYIVDFQPHELELPALEAIESSLARRTEEIAKNVIGASSNDVALAKHQQERIEESASLLRQAMPLILNGLFYLESLEGSFSSQPGRDAPPEWTTLWESSVPSRRQKIRSKLTREGYAVVHLLGQEVDAVQTKFERGATAPYWRRGHWRMQAHGEQRALRKRIRIAAVFVNPHSAPTDDVPGHIYVGGDNRP